MERIAIGEPDLTRVKRIVGLYDKLLLMANHIQLGLNELYNGYETVNLDFVFELIESKTPEETIIRRYIEFKKISIPGLDNEKLIKSELIDINRKFVDQLLVDLKDFKKIVNELAIDGCTFPIREMYNKEDAEGLFMLPESFENDVIESLQIYVTNEAEHQLLQAMQKMSDALNDLVELKILPKDRRCLDLKIFLINCFDIRTGDPRPVKVSQKLFNNQRLRHISGSNRPALISFDKTKMLS